MPITYRVDREKNLIEENWYGTITSIDLKQYWKHYLADPAVLEIRRTIVDLREATIKFTGAELNALIESIVLPALKGRDWKSAIVVKEPLQFGISRQYQAFADNYSKDAIFRSAEEAQSWLDSS